MWKVKYNDYISLLSTFVVPVFLVVLLNSLRRNPASVQSHIFGCSQSSIFKSLALFTLVSVNAFGLILPYETFVRYEPFTLALVIVPLLLVFIGGALVLIPVLHYPRSVSIMQYLEERYHSKLLRTFSAIYSVILMLVYAILTLTGCVELVSAIVDNLSNWLICFILMTIIMIPVLHRGFIDLCDLSNVYWLFYLLSGLYSSIGLAIYRNSFSLNLDTVLKIRYHPAFLDLPPCIYTTLLGGFVLSLCLLISQPTYQIYAALSSKKKSKIFVSISCLLILLSLVSIMAWHLVTRLLLHQTPVRCAGYEYFDTVVHSVVDSLRTVWQAPSMPGLVLSAICTVHTVTVGMILLSITTIVWEHFARYSVLHTKENYQLSVFRLLNFIICVIVCGFSVLVLFFIPNIWPYIYKVCIITGALYTPIASVIVVGIVFPCANSKGAFAGISSSLIVIGYIIIGMIYYQPSGFSTSSDILQSSKLNCSIPTQLISQPMTNIADLNDTLTLMAYSSTTNVSEDSHRNLLRDPSSNDTTSTPLVIMKDDYFVEIPAIFSLNVLLLPPIACAMTVFMTMLVSLATGGQDIYSIDWNLLLWTCNKWSEQCRPQCNTRYVPRSRGPYVASESFRYAQHGPLPDTSYCNPRVQSMYIKQPSDTTKTTVIQ